MQKILLMQFDTRQHHGFSLKKTAQFLMKCKNLFSVAVALKIMS